MTAPPVSFDEWLSIHFGDVLARFHEETHGEDCVWMFLRYARWRYLVALYGEAAVATRQFYGEGEAA